MEAIVVDCSLVAAFILREAAGEKFDRVVLGAAKGDMVLHAPPLLPYEILNVLVIARRRRRLTAEQAADARHLFDLLPIHIDSPPPAPVRAAIHELAQLHTLTAYDACYLELAQRLQARLLALDGDLLKLRRHYPRIG